MLAVPFLDTGFVVAKRIKYRRPVYQGDSNHFHHRFHRIGFSQRRTVLYLYGWTITMAALAVAVRFIPYTDDRGHWNLGWSLVLAALLRRRLRGERLPRARAGDPQAAAPARLAAAPRRPGDDGRTRSTPRSSASWRRASSGRSSGQFERGEPQKDSNPMVWRTALVTGRPAGTVARPQPDALRRGGEQTG